VATNQQTCEQFLAALSPAQQAAFLSQLGHELTVLARSAYEFQGPGVSDPRLLRDLNEISHRIFSQVASLIAGRAPNFEPDILAGWLLGEDKPHLQARLAGAFDRAVRRNEPVA
jgi:hypothetical protein